MQDWTVPGWVVLATLAAALFLGTLLGLALMRTRARASRALEQAHVEAAALQARVDGIERRLAEPPEAGDAREYVITRLGADDVEPVPAVEASLFTDMVVRESVVRAASLAAGLKRALAPEMRHRIRFEMKREVKRARKQRRSDLRAARREWEAHQRAEVDLDPGSAA